jgi:superfamily II DNA or RNA helicase
MIAGNVWTYFDGKYPAGVIDSVTSYRVEGRWFAKSFKQGHWDGIKRFREYDRRRGVYRMPTGFLSRVTTLLDKLDYPYEVVDEREFRDAESVYELAGGIRLDQGKYSYQAGLLDTALNHGHGTIKAATGAGKTEVGAGIIASYGVRTLWLTHRQQLLHQTRTRLSERLDQEIGIVGDGQWNIKPVTVAMIQTLGRGRNKKQDLEKFIALKKEREKFIASAELVIADEVHHLESDQWLNVFSLMTTSHKFGLTATPTTDGAGLALVGMTGEIIAEIGPHELIERGVLVPPRIWWMRFDTKALPKKMPYPTAYKMGVTQNVARNEAIIHVARIFQAEGKNCITLVRRINHGEIVADMLSQVGVRTQFIQGKVKQETRMRWLRELQNGELDHIVAQAEILGEGVDVPWLRAVINATGTRGGGSKQSSAEHEVGRGTIQFLGRGLRQAPGKTHFEYVDLMDAHQKSLAEAARERVRTLEDEGYGAHVKYWSERVVGSEALS